MCPKAQGQRDRSEGRVAHYIQDVRGVTKMVGLGLAQSHFDGAESHSGVLSVGSKCSDSCRSGIRDHYTAIILLISYPGLSAEILIGTPSFQPPVGELKLLERSRVIASRCSFV